MLANRKESPLIFMVALSVFTTDLYLCSFKDIAVYFRASPDEVKLSLTVYFIGMALFTLVSSILGHRFGRKNILVVSSLIYIIGTFCTLIAPSIPLFILGRFLQSFGGASSSVLARGLAAKSPSVLSWMFVAVSTSVLLAPLLGGSLHTLYGWKANFIFMTLLGTISLLCSWFLPEEKKERSFSLKEVQKELLAPLQNSRYLLFTLIITLTWMGFLSFISTSQVFLLYHCSCSPLLSSLLYSIAMAGFVSGSLVAKKRKNILPLALICLAISSVFFPFVPSQKEGFTFCSLFFLFGAGMILPYAQIQAVSSLERTQYAFGIMYFIMMLFGTIPSLLVTCMTNKEAVSPFLMSVLGIILVSSMLILKKRIKKNTLTTYN